jgi:sugar phosphate permease
MSTETGNPQGIDKKDRLVAVSLVVFCLCFQSIGTSGVSLFLPLIQKDFGASFTQGGALAAALYLTYAIMQIPAGYMADRFGRKKVFVVGMLGTTIMMLLFGMVTEYWQAMSNQAVSGLFRALLFAPGMALLASWFSPQRRATAMALYQIGMFLGQVIFNLTGPIMAAGSDWRFPFIVFSIAGIAASGAYLWAGKEPPTTATQMLKVSEVVHLLRYRIIWFCNIIQYVRLAVFQGISFWLPTLLINDKGLSLQVTGFIVALRFFLIGPTNILGSYISDRLKNHTLIIVISLVVLIITTPLMAEVDNMAALIAVIIVNSLFIQLYFGPLFSIPVKALGSHLTATTTGIGNFFANLGAFTFAYLLGALKDATGSFSIGFYTMAGACVISLIFTIMLAKIDRKSSSAG